VLKICVNLYLSGFISVSIYIRLYVEASISCSILMFLGRKIVTISKPPTVTNQHYHGRPPSSFSLSIVLAQLRSAVKKLRFPKNLSRAFTYSHPKFCIRSPKKEVQNLFKSNIIYLIKTQIWIWSELRNSIYDTESGPSTLSAMK